MALNTAELLVQALMLRHKLTEDKAVVEANALLNLLEVARITALTADELSALKEAAFNEGYGAGANSIVAAFNG